MVKPKPLPPSGYERFQTQEEAKPSDLTLLARLAGELNAAQVDVAKLEEQLQRAQERVKQLEERQIPSIMDRIGMASFTTTNGFRIEIRSKIHASIPVANRQRAMEWLDEHGHGGLIKHTVAVAFSRDQQKAAEKLETQLGKKFENVRVDQKVEPATLTAFLKEQLEQGEEVPMDLFGAYESRVAKITTVK